MSTTSQGKAGYEAERRRGPIERSRLAVPQEVKLVMHSLRSNARSWIHSDFL